MRPAVILRPAEEIKLRHRHGQIGFLGEAFEHALDGRNLAGDDVRAGRSFIDVDANGVSARAGIVRSLIDADREAAIDRGGNFLLWADEEWLCSVLITDAPDNRAAARVVERKDTQQILEAAGKAG